MSIFKKHSDLTFVHSGQVILVVDDNDWKENPLKAVYYWIENSLLNRHLFPHGGLGENARKATLDTLCVSCSVQGNKVARGEGRGLINVLGLCNIIVQKMPNIGNALDIRFVDNENRPHLKYAESFVETHHKLEHGAKCGLVYTEAVVEYTFANQYLSGSSKSTVHIYEAGRVVKAIVDFYSQLHNDVSRVLEEAIRDALAQKQNFRLSQWKGIASCVSLQNVARVIRRPEDAQWLNFFVEPGMNSNNSPIPVKLKLTFWVGHEGFNSLRYCDPDDGNSITGFAMSVKHAIDRAIF